jgi:hypothetical protein
MNQRPEVKVRVDSDGEVEILVDGHVVASVEVTRSTIEGGVRHTDLRVRPRRRTRMTSNGPRLRAVSTVDVAYPDEILRYISLPDSGPT